MARHPLPYSWNPTGPWSGVGRPTILSSSSLAFRRTGQDEMQGREAVGDSLCLDVLACISWPHWPRRPQFGHVLKHVGDALVFLCIVLACCTNNHRSHNLVIPVSILFPSILCMHPRKQSREIHDEKKTPKLRPCSVMPHPSMSNNPTHPLSLRVNARHSTIHLIEEALISRRRHRVRRGRRERLRRRLLGRRRPRARSGRLGSRRTPRGPQLHRLGHHLGKVLLDKRFPVPTTTR